jgi:endonuclease-3
VYDVILGNAFGINEGVVVDTHVKRVSRRLALTRHTEPEKIERDLMRLWPKEEWAGVSLSMILHGRRVCEALRPRCSSRMRSPASHSPPRSPSRPGATTTRQTT